MAVTGGKGSSMNDLKADLVAQERAAKVAWALAEGERLNVQDVADYVGLTRTGAYRMMYKLARAIPITIDGAGRWVRMDKLAPEAAPNLTKRVRRHPQK